MLHRNLPLKAASFLLAVFLWFWVLLSEENPIVEVTVKVPVTAQGVRPGLAPERDLPEVAVRVRGLRREVGEVSRQVEAFVSCRGLEAGTHRLSVDVRVPENVTQIGVRPSEIPVTLEEVVSEARPVELRLVGEPPAGYELTGAEVSPEVVRVSGPRSQVDRASRVLVTMDLGRAVPEVDVSVPARAVDSSGNRIGGVSLMPATAHVLAKMKLVVASRTVPVVLRTGGSLPSDLRITSAQVEPAMVTIVGPAGRVQEITQIETVELTLSGVRGSFTRVLHLVVPDGVNLLTDPSVKVAVKVERVVPGGATPEEEVEGSASG